MDIITEYIKASKKILPGSDFNVYCDESCHLENDGKKAMSLGAVWCPKDKTGEINKRLREIKHRHGIRPDSEVKWTKASPGNMTLYMDFLDYFFDDDDLHFRGLVIPDKSKLNHARYHQTHDEWYYKMYFTMLKTIFSRDDGYYVYIDIKDTHSAENARKLEDVCANNRYAFGHEIIRRVQPIRSEEVQLMQLVDILIGALAYRHNNMSINPKMNATKVAIVNRIIERSHYGLIKSTPLKEDKFNLFIWDSDYGENS